MKTFIKNTFFNFMVLYTIWIFDMMYHLETNEELKRDDTFGIVVPLAACLWCMIVGMTMLAYCEPPRCLEEQ